MAENIEPSTIIWRSQIENKIKIYKIPNKNANNVRC